MSEKSEPKFKVGSLVEFVKGSFKDKTTTVTSVTFDAKAKEYRYHGFFCGDHVSGLESETKKG